MTLISTLTANNTANNLSWTGLSGYDKYQLIIENIIFASGSNVPNIQVGTGVGPSYLTSGYSTELLTVYGGTSGGNAQANISKFIIGQVVNGNLAGQPYNAFVNITGITSGTVAINGQSMSAYGSGPLVFEGDTFTGSLVNTTTVTAIKFYATGNIVSGTASLYGISS